MKWIKDAGGRGCEAEHFTYIAEVARGVLVRTSNTCLDEDGNGMSEALCFIPDCRITDGIGGERTSIVARTETR